MAKRLAEIKQRLFLKPSKPAMFTTSMTGRSTTDQLVFLPLHVSKACAAFRAPEFWKRNRTREGWFYANAYSALGMIVQDICSFWMNFVALPFPPFLCWVVFKVKVCGFVWCEFHAMVFIPCRGFPSTYLLKPFAQVKVKQSLFFFLAQMKTFGADPLPYCSKNPSSVWWTHHQRKICRLITFPFLERSFRDNRFEKVLRSS